MPKLTTKAVDAAKAGPVRREIADDLTRGLYLIVQPSGAKSLAVRYRIGGKPVKETLGRYPDVSLADARERARTLLGTVAKGVDPRAEREAQKQAAAEAKANTVAAVADDFVRLHCQRRNRTWRDQERVLRTNVLPRIGALPIADLRRRDVARLVDDLGDRPQAARVALAIVRKMLAWAVERGIVEANVASGIKAAPVKRRDRVLSDDELRAVWTAADAAGWPFGAYVQMLILTGCRRGEIAAMRWQDLDGAVFTIAAENYKTAVAHVVPLSRLALEVLASVPRIEGQTHVFAGRGDVPLSGFAKRKTALGQAAGVDFALHDLRRTVRTGLSRLRVPFEVAERVLGHVPGGVSQHYDRFNYMDEKRQALEAWARHVDGLINPQPANVIPMSGAR